MAYIAIYGYGSLIRIWLLGGYKRYKQVGTGEKEALSSKEVSS